MSVRVCVLVVFSHGLAAGPDTQLLIYAPDVIVHGVVTDV